MNAAERLQAAITKLETLKAESTPGDWFITYQASRWPRVWGNRDDDEADAVAQTEGGTRNADLIVTLHRTIDAQVEGMRTAVKYIRANNNDETVLDDLDLRFALTLADAILGGGES